MKYLRRFLQPSTLRGLVLLLAVFGVNVEPEQADAVITVAGSVVGAIEVFRNEEKGVQ